MANIRDLRIKIKSTKNMQQITRAMKMVATARFRRAQQQLEAARPYARKIAEVTLDLASLTPWSFNPLLRPHEHTKKVLILVFTGDRGMAGGFHLKIADGAHQFSLKFQGQAEVSYYMLGLKGFQRFTARKLPVYKRFPAAVAGVPFSEVQKLAEEISDLYLNEEYDQIYLYYSKFYSTVTQKPRAFQLLPIDPSKARHKEEHGLFIFEPNQEAILDNILPRYIESEIYRAFLETEAGELGARMTAMSSATDNAGELIERYQLIMNRIRQSQITTEIAEIVGGAEALKA
ncbi:MAG TPA: ATP synthase F1 subunit gamma [Firmicutes bacterium]|nr:ATP synthase F1 subunit gamma [Bacillota bacterium]